MAAKVDDIAVPGRAAAEGHGAVLSGPAGGKALQSQTRQAVQDIAFGSLAGVVGKYVEYPFDTVKVRLQSQNAASFRHYAGPLDCFRQSISQDGFWSLYRGISAPLLGAAIETSSLFFSYRLAQNFLRATYYKSRDPLPFGALVACGAVSGAFTSLLLTPIELVKCRLQVPTNAAPGVRAPGPLHVIRSVFQQRGLAGFWHGQLGTLIRETGGSAAWFGSFEGASLLFKSARSEDIAAATPLYIHQQLLAGAIAGMSYNFVFYPADTIKSRMQTEDTRGTLEKRQTFWGTGQNLWREQGLRGIYRGCGITVGRAAPSSALIFTIYEALKHAFME